MNSAQLRQLFVSRQALNKRIKGSSTYQDLLNFLGCIQIDPVSVVSPNLNLVAFNRLEKYKETDYIKTLQKGTSFEYYANAMCNISHEYWLSSQLIAEQKLHNRQAERTKYQQACISILDQLSNEPCRSIDLEGEGSINNNWTGLKARKLTSYLLEILLETGEVTVVNRINGHKVYGIAQPRAVYDFDTSYEALFKLYLRARTFIPANQKILWLKGYKTEFMQMKERLIKSQNIQEVLISGKPYLISQTEDGDSFDSPEEHLRFLSPLDNMLWDRKLVSQLFEYDYKWEIYTPAADRVHGPYSMPILYNYNIIGELSFAKREGELVVVKGVMKQRYHDSQIVGKKMISEIKKLAVFLNLNPTFDFWNVIKKISI